MKENIDKDYITLFYKYSPESFKIKNRFLFQVLTSKNFNAEIASINETEDLRANIGICGVSNILIKNGFVERATVLIEKTGNYICLLNYANRLYNENKYQEAIIIYQKIIQNQQENIDIHRKLAAIYIEFSQDENAINEYKKIISIKPESNDYIEIIRLYRKNQLYTDALGYAREALRKYSYSPWLAYELSNIYVDLGMEGAATKTVENAIEYRSISRNYYTKCVVYFRLGKPDESIEACKQSLNLDPLFDQPYEKLIEYYYKEGQIIDALDYANQYLELSIGSNTSNVYKAYIYLGSLYQLLGNEIKSQEYLCAAYHISDEEFFTDSKIKWLENVQYYCNNR